jgi:formate dehydrogenase
MPSSYPLKELPKLEKYPDGMTLPSPKGRDFTPGELLGCVSGELGLRKFLEDRGHTLVVTSDKDAEGCTADKELVDAEDKEQTIYLYCRSGNRSGKAEKALRSIGYINAKNIGGINEASSTLQLKITQE